MAEGLVGGMFSTATNLMQLGLNYKQNAQLMAQQKELNEQMRHDAHNAYTIATADRLRAGLSPIDGQPAQVAAMTAAQQSPYTDLSKMGEGIQSAIINSRRLRNETNLNNAQVANIDADTVSKVSDAQFKIATLQDRLDAMREETKQKKFKTFADRSEWYSRMDELEEQIRHISAQTTNLLHSTANEMSMNPRMQAESISRANVNNSQAAKNRIETHGAFVGVRQKLHDLLKSQRFNIRSSDKLPSLILRLVSEQDRIANRDGDLIKATVQAAQDYAKYNKMSDTQFMDYLLTELETVLTYAGTN